MCGIVGLFLKDPELEPQLGAMLAGMLGTLCDRGPDSAGFAVYGRPASGAIKLTIRGPRDYDFAALLRRIAPSGAPPVHVVRDTHLVLTLRDEDEMAARAEIAAIPELTIVGGGRRMEIFKEIGRPDHVARQFGLDAMSGTHALGHTRMATESAVTTDGAHPFTTGADQCLVHNGSLSNHNGLRRDLIRHGFSFQTDNDTEVAAAFMSWKMREGASLDQALSSSLVALDGFYTFVVGTETGFGVLRDPIACKPAVMAETDRWVAFGTEYRALVGLPGVDAANVWEPAPAKAYLWQRH
jgi:methylamine---glutamate N-methyltransferase subunit A